MEFVFVTKVPISEDQESCVEMDITKANFENMRVYKRIHSRCNRHGISWIIKKTPIMSSLPDEAIYFKDNPLFEYSSVDDDRKCIRIGVCDIAIAKMNQVSLLKPDEIQKAKNFFLQKFGFNAPRTMDSTDKLRKELVKALKHNGVEVNG